MGLKISFNTYIQNMFLAPWAINNNNNNNNNYSPNNVSVFLPQALQFVYFKNWQLADERCFELPCRYWKIYSLLVRHMKHLEKASQASQLVSLPGGIPAGFLSLFTRYRKISRKNSATSRNILLVYLLLVLNFSWSENTCLRYRIYSEKVKVKRYDTEIYPNNEMYLLLSLNYLNYCG